MAGNTSALNLTMLPLYKVYIKYGKHVGLVVSLLDCKLSWAAI